MMMKSAVGLVNVPPIGQVVEWIPAKFQLCGGQWTKSILLIFQASTGTL